MYLLGYDIGSSSVKASLIEIKSGKCIAGAFSPKEEMKIKELKSGWAEQDPEMWWTNLKIVTKEVLAASGVKKDEIKAIGIKLNGLI